MNATVTRLRASGFEVWCSPDCGIVLVHGDCLRVLPLLEPGSVDCVLADPPYGMDWDGRVTRGPNGTGKKGPTRHFGTRIIGDMEPFDPSPWIQFRGCILFGCNHFASRLPVGTTLVWLKRYDSGFGSFLSDAELAWMKGGCGVYCHRDVSLQGMSDERLHSNQKPVGIMIWCLSFLPPGTILDPYMGSGTVPVACLRTGRRCLAIEIEPQTPDSHDYFGIAVRRVEAELGRHPLFEPPPKRQRELI